MGLHPLPQRYKIAAGVLRSGGIVAYPTEAVWGLGCDPHNAAAVDALLAMKNRHVDKGLILVAASIDQFDDYLRGLNRPLRQQLQQSWPGPMTWLAPDNGFTPPWIRGRHNKVALRVSAHPVVASLCRSFGGAIVSTSANVTGRPSLSKGWQVRRCFGQAVDYYLEGLVGNNRRPTEIRDLLSGDILRHS